MCVERHGGRKDRRGKKKTQNIQDFTKVKTGDTITWGHYDVNDNEKMEWIVLDINENENKILVISKYVMDQKLRYEEIANSNADTQALTWKSSSIKHWLNNTFISQHFNDSELGWIVEKTNKNPDASMYNLVWKGLGGNQTEDKLFLLSFEEIDQYLSDEVDRKACQKAGNGKEVCSWWLRSPGMYSHEAMYVNEDGEIASGNVSELHGVRPAMYLKIKAEEEK